MSSGENTFPIGSRQPGAPVSLVQPASTVLAKRRALKSVKADNGAPTTANQGFFTQNKRWLHIVISMPDAATTMDWKLWTWDAVSEKWCLDTRLGTSGVVSMVAADSPSRSIVEIDGLDKVYIELDNMGGVFTSGVDVWLATSGTVEPG